MKRILIALVVAALLVILLRSCAFTSCTVFFRGEETALCEGDRVLVNRWSYGMCLPWNTERLGLQRMLCGEYALFHYPAVQDNRSVGQRPLAVGRCVGEPGDTLWLSREYLPVRPGPEGGGFPFVVPSRGGIVEVQPWNITLLCNTITQHEGGKAYIREGQLYVNGKPARSVRFSKDYYWMASRNVRNLNDSRLYGFLPHDHLVGRLSWIWFSHDPSAPLWSGYRWQRFFRPVK